MTDWLYTFGRDGCSYFGLKWCFAGWWQDGLWPVVWILLGIGLLLAWTARRKSVTSPSGTSSPQHSTTPRAPCSLNSRAALLATCR